MFRHLSIILIGLALLLGTAAPAPAQSIDDALLDVMDAAAEDETIPVIIRLKDASGGGSSHASDVAAEKLAELLQENAAASQGLLRALLEARGIQGILSLWIINGLAVELTADQILTFAAHPDVTSIVLDQDVPAPIVPQALTSTGVAWDNLAAVGAPDLWAADIDGTGVVVATMDTGIDAQHPDLAAAWRGGTNSWFDPHGQHETPYDYSGHGTQVMGVLVGGAAGGTPIGMAPGARWIAVKLWDDAGNAQYSDIHLGFQWLLDPDGRSDTADAPHVVNNSWGLANAVGQCTEEFRQDIQVLQNAGIAVVFSGGNYGPSPASNTSPANYAESASTGAVDQFSEVADFSSRGPSACDGALFPVVAAPGVDIYTAERTLGGVNPDPYTTATGTSVAAPHLAGAMALLKDAYPGADVTDLEGALTFSAVDLGVPGEDNDSGHGMIDVAAAADLLDNPPGCTDGDNDGYFGAADCGTPVDCDDTDPATHPGAVEVKHDGVDQNCNGYDLTIDIVRAVYLADDDTLSVAALSSLGAQAALELAGYGAMKWDRKKGIWTIDVRRAGGDPGKVTVAGIEGLEIIATTVESGGGDSGGGKPPKPRK